MDQRAGSALGTVYSGCAVLLSFAWSGRFGVRRSGLTLAFGSFEVLSLAGVFRAKGQVRWHLRLEKAVGRKSDSFSRADVASPVIFKS